MKKMLLKMVLPIVSLSAVGVASAISITSCSVEGHTVEVQDLGFLKAVLAEGGDIANNAKDTSSRDLGLEESTDVTNSKMLKVINDGMNIDRASYLVCLSQVLVMGLLTVAEQWTFSQIKIHTEVQSHKIKFDASATITDNEKVNHQYKAWFDNYFSVCAAGNALIDTPFELGGDYAKTGSPGFQIGTADSSAKNLNVIVDSRPIDESPFPCLDVTGTVGGDEGNTLKNVYPNWENWPTAPETK